MRTIKFRGKRSDTKEWVYGFYGLSLDDKHYIIEATFDHNGGRCYFFDTEVIPETVGQFTGKKDDGEDDLYDGDIIRFGCGRTATGAIRWSEEHCAWIVKEVGNKNEFMLSDCFDDFIEKIGNIHDNHELLEVK